ncbi:flagellar hook-associated protein FlgK [Pseudomonas gingeri]|uniref:Flagellar hook-associated protein 1 n=1 Tax=Pseudomonas gingeri TaxID=117681 RepID=A0A7Y7X8K7_9PSED|nr:flagellar hook-associated protein FlgK [Pseudomonas gingeri]NWB95046.1 flagellar hook-associated protein FlgK [Pseudomonas gingeri]NWD75363.1 flagellar hook-associated protein FlgK [Pseudomonas gingeri]
MSLLNIGMTGLNAASTALNTTGNNISNVNTPGYSRQSTVQTSSASQQYGNVFIGTGTTLADVRRVYSAYLDSQLQTSTALNSDSSSYLAQVTPTDSMLSDANTGMTASLQQFFSSLQSVSTTPTDDASRQTTLTSAQALSNKLNSLSQQLSQQNTGINSNLSDMSDQVNKLATTIAQYNDQISKVTTAAGAPNDLLDQRSEAVRQLSELVGTQVVQRGSSYDVYIGNGQPLVMGNTTNTLSAVPSKDDPSQSALQLDRGSSTVDITSTVTGGEIGGLLRYRSDVLEPSINALGRIAMVTADQMNKQQAQGIDKNGNFGSPLFTDINSPSLISQRSIANANNSAGSGNLNVTIADTGALTTNDYQVTFSSATNYSVTRSDGTAMGTFSTTTTPAPVIDGITLSLTGGAMSPGDSFKVTPTRSGASDIQTVMTNAQNIAAAAPLTGVTSANNGGTYTQPTLVDQLGTSNATNNAQLQDAIKYGTPVKIVFGAPGTGATAGTQSYTLTDAQGNTMGTGTIVPGQSNTLNLNVNMVDSTGAAVLDPVTGLQKTFTVQTTVAGNPAAGESFTMSMTGAGSSDNRNSTALIALQNSKTVGTGATNGGSSISDAYGSLISTVGSKAAQATSDNTATTTILTNATNAQSSLSGVNLDEESANLVKYQQYYTAASQIIKAAQAIFSTLLSSL